MTGLTVECKCEKSNYLQKRRECVVVSEGWEKVDYMRWQRRR